MASAAVRAVELNEEIKSMDNQYLKTRAKILNDTTVDMQSVCGTKNNVEQDATCTLF